MNAANVSGLYKLTVAQRIGKLRELGWLSEGDALRLKEGHHVLSLTSANHMIENVIGVFGLPFAVAPNFLVNGRECIVPLVVEEPSIVAGLSSAAAAWFLLLAGTSAAAWACGRAAPRYSTGCDCWRGHRRLTRVRQ